MLARMSVYHCTPASAPLDATVVVPGSKSLTNRALIAAALADGTSVLRNALFADDTLLMMESLGTLGIAVTADDRDCAVEVTGCRGHIPESGADLFCGNSGTTIRFLSAMVALGNGRFQLDGIARMRKRPIGALGEALQALGAGIEYPGTEGFPPMVVHARGLHGGHVAFDSPQSSQMVSALLLAAPYAARDVFIEVAGDVPSLSFLRMTTAVMDRFGVGVLEDYAGPGGDRTKRFIVEAPQRYQATTLTIEPDATNATYFFAAAAVAGGRVTVQGLGLDSVQGDVGFVDVLERMGCRVERETTRVSVLAPPEGCGLRGIDIDLNDMPDTVPTLAVLALFADSPTAIRNVANLRLKETDRLAALHCELSKLGADVEELPDGLVIHPPHRLTPAAIDTYDDHRMAMSFALVGLKCPGMVINDPQCCTKTFPNFFERFERMIAAGSGPAPGST
jgi:3-phosphoshikimate 1-carboxyvinyltransferase